MTELLRPLLGAVAPYGGTIGAILFALCNLPIIIQIYVKRSSEGVSLPYVLMSFCANIGCGLFVLDNNLTTGVWQYQLYFNYGTALVFCAWILWLIHRFRPKDK